MISQSLDLEIKDYEKQRVQSDESVRLEITLSKEQYELVKRETSLMSHVNPSATVSDVIEYLAKDFLKRKDPMSQPTADELEVKNGKSSSNRKSCTKEDAKKSSGPQEIKKIENSPSTTSAS